MALEDIGVRAVIDNLGGFLSGMDRMGNKMSALGKKMTSLGKTMTLRVTAPLAAIGGISLKMAADFDKSLREVNTLLNLSSEQFDQLKSDVVALSNEIGVATSEVVPALYQAISAGVPRENVLEFLEIAAKAAIGGVTDTETAVDGLTTVLNAFGLDASKTQLVADQMFTAVKLGKTTFEELSASMSIVAPFAAALGVGFDEIAASTATLTKAGAPTSDAMTQIRSALVALTKPTKDMATLLEKAGFASGQAALDALGFAGTLEALRDATQGSNEALTLAFGRVEAVQAVLGLTGEKAALAAADMEEMADAAGSGTEAFEEMDKSTSRTITRVTVRIKNLALAIGEELLPVAESLAAVMSKVTRFITNLTSVFASLPTPIKGVAIGFFGILTIAGPVLIILGSLIGAIGSIAGAVTGASAALAGIGLSFTALLGPIGLAIVAIGVLAVLWIKNIGGMRDKTKDFFQSIADLFGAFKTLFDSFTKGAGDMGAVWGRVWESIERALEIVWVTVLQPILNSLQNAIDFLTIAVSILAGDWGTAWDKIKDIVIRTVDVIIDQINLVLDGFAALVKVQKAILDTIPFTGKLTKGLQKVIDTLEQGIPRLRATTDELGAMDEMLVNLGMEELPRYEEQVLSATQATGFFGDETEETASEVENLSSALGELTGWVFQVDEAVDSAAVAFLGNLTNLERLGIETDVYTELVRILTERTGDYQEALRLVNDQMQSKYRVTLQGVIDDTLSAAEATDALKQSMNDLNGAGQPLSERNLPSPEEVADSLRLGFFRSVNTAFGFPALPPDFDRPPDVVLTPTRTAAEAQRILDLLIAAVGAISESAPHFAFGGVMARSGIAIVGERGPEIVNLPGGAVVQPLASQGDTFNVEINHVDRAEDEIIMDMDTVRLLAQT